MQVVICLPNVSPHGAVPEAVDALRQRKVAGIPLLRRVLLTAVRAGASSVVVVHPKGSHLADSLPEDTGVELEGVELESDFDPERAEDWRALAPRLERRFVWLPWSYVTITPVLRALLSAAEDGPDAALPPLSEPDETPQAVDRDALLALGSLRRYREEHPLTPVAVADIPGVVVDTAMPGVCVHTCKDVRRAERLLIRGSGKSTDGLHSKLNRWLSRPLVHALVKTPVTANMVTWAGIPIVVLSALYFTEGRWAGYTMGALLYWFSVLLDEVDGMIARTKFQESPFGCWLETFVDYSSYFFLWSGISYGLYRGTGSLWYPALGIVVMVLNVFIFLVLLRQRREIVPADQPENFSKRFVGRLDADSGSLLSRIIRKVVHFPKRGVFCHYLVLFSVFGGLHILFGFVVTGAAATLFVSLYVNRLLRIPVGASSQPSVTA